MSTVQEIINAANNRTNDAIRDANNVLSVLSGESRSRNVLGAIQNVATINETALDAKPVDELIIMPANIDNIDGAVDFTGVGDKSGDVDDLLSDLESVDNLSSGSFDNSADSIGNPANVDNISAQTLSNPQAPTAADINLHNVSVNLPDSGEPVLSVEIADFKIPAPDSIDIGSYTVDAPAVGYLAPTNNFSFVEQDYSSDFRVSILSALSDDIENGGSGINTDDEQSLFERGRDREAITYKDSGQAIARNFAARGFKLPPSAMASLMDKARDGFNRAMSGINRDILLQRSDLHVKARQFAIQAGTTLDNAALAYHGSVMERAMNSAKLVASFAIEFHNLEVDRFTKTLDRWVKISAVKTQWVDNAIKKTKEYELKLAKLELDEKQNDRRIKLMDSMNKAVSITEDIRKTSLEVEKLYIESDRSKIALGKQQVDLYIASLKGDETLVNLYESQIQAANSKNEPFKLKLQKREQNIKLNEADAKFRLQDKSTEIDVFKTKLAHLSQLMEREQDGYETELSKARTLAERLNINLKEWDMTMKIPTNNLGREIAYKESKAKLHGTYRELVKGQLVQNADWLNTGTELNIKSANGALKVYGDLIMGAQSALGTISTLAE